MANVFFAFGVAGNDRRWVPTASLVAFLDELGMSESAARGALARLRETGRLEARRRGREVDLRLSEASLGLVHRFQERLRDDRPAWDGVFHGLLFTIPERQRDYRDRLRRAATLLGFGPLRPGLLVTPYADRFTPLDRTLADAPDGSRLLRVQLQVDRADAGRVVAETWELGSLATAYRRHVRTLDRTTDWVREGSRGGRTVLRMVNSRAQALYRTVASDPALPSDVLPADWPAVRVGEALTSLLLAARPVLLPYVRAIAPDLMPDPESSGTPAAMAASSSSRGGPP